MAVEGLFAEYDAHLRNCMNQIWKPDFSLKNTTPSFFSGVVSGARRQRIQNQENALLYLRKQQEVKDSFWVDVKSTSTYLNLAMFLLSKS